MTVTLEHIAEDNTQSARLSFMLLFLSLDVVIERQNELHSHLGGDEVQVRDILRNLAPLATDTRVWGKNALTALTREVRPSVLTRVRWWCTQVFWCAVYEPHVFGHWSVLFQQCVSRPQMEAKLSVPPRIGDEFWAQVRRALDDEPFVTLLDGSPTTEWDLKVRCSSHMTTDDGDDAVDAVCVSIARVVRLGELWRWITGSLSGLELEALVSRGNELRTSEPTLAFIEYLAPPHELATRSVFPVEPSAHSPEQT